MIKKGAVLAENHSFSLKINLLFPKRESRGSPSPRRGSAHSKEEFRGIEAGFRKIEVVDRQKFEHLRRVAPI